MKEADADVIRAGELVFAAPRRAVALVGSVSAVRLSVAHPRRRYAAALGRHATRLLRSARLAAVVVFTGGVHRFPFAVLFIDARLAVLFTVAPELEKKKK